MCVVIYKINSLWRLTNVSTPCSAGPAELSSGHRIRTQGHFHELDSLFLGCHPPPNLPDLEADGAERLAECHGGASRRETQSQGLFRHGCGKKRASAMAGRTVGNAR